ncbi:MAG: GAF domain-containing sensor histidine kinase [Solirubrobacterales bacterium]|nr:GAF domain-containing sensor histidine kinase [Solirubrobacterales bacterium]
MGRAMVADLDLESVLERVLGAARELTGARYAALGILDPSRSALERFLTAGVDDATKDAIGDLPHGHGLLGELIRRPQPLRLDDLAEHPRSYGFPHAHPPMTSFLGVPVLVRGKAWGNLYLTEKAGGPFDAGDEHALVVLAEWAAVAIDNARLYSDVERQRDELARAVRSLEATTTIARAVGGETDLGTVLELIAKRARALVDARTVLILLVNGDELVLAAGAGEADPAHDLRIPLEDSVPGAVLSSRRPERLADVRTRLRLSLGRLPESAQTALLVPLVFRGQSSGLLIALDRTADGPEFTKEDERLLSAFAASGATAVATAQTVEAQRLRDSLTAAEEERKRWSRELHDETLQGLGALQVMLSAAQRAPDPSEHLRRASEHLEQEIDRLQELIAQLRPASLDQIGLAAALEHLVNRTSEAIEATVDCDISLPALRDARGPTQVAPDVESTIYRVVQEALNNARKHAEPSRISVRVTEAGGWITAEVLDDGRGFEPATVDRGFGLVGMSERLALVGGRIDVVSTPGSGTKVRARAPLRGADDADLGLARRA